MLTAPSLRAAAILAVTASLAAAPSASAAPTWLPAETVSEPQTSSGGAIGAALPSIAMSASGEAVAVWPRRDATNTFWLQASFRPPGGTWSAPQDIAPTRPYTEIFFALVRPPALAINARGDAIVLFERPNAQQVIQAAFRPAGGRFESPVDLTGLGQNAATPSLAMNRRGDAVATWVRSNGTHDLVQASTRPAGGSFGAAQDISSPGQSAREPTVAIDESGRAVVAWRRFDGSNSVVQAAVRPADGPFGAAQTLSVTGQNTFGMSAAIDSAGRALVVWSGSIGANLIAQAASRGTGGAFSAPQDLSQPGSNAQIAQARFDRDDAAVVAWVRGGVVEAVARPAGGSFGAPQTISGAGVSSPSYGLQLATDRTGAVLAHWARGIINAPAEVTRRPPGGTFGAVTTISPPDIRASAGGIAVDDAGNAAAVYHRQPVPGQGGTVEIHVAGFDFAPPNLESVNVPGTGTVGVPLPVSAAPKDVWSAVTTTWGFGDGASATGASASHAFTTAGTYTVSVTATDAVGNAATVTRQVQISAAPSTPTPIPQPGVTPIPQPGVARPAVAGVDRDGDGFLAGQDCNDDDPAIRPGAVEIRGNRTDENCDGTAEPFPTLGSGVATRWNVRGTAVRLTALRITQQFPRGWKARIRCAGRRCPFKTKTLKPAKVRRGASNVLASLRSRERRFRAGQIIEVWLSAPGYNTKVARYVLRRGRIPTTQPLCVRPGETRPQRACD